MSTDTPPLPAWYVISLRPRGQHGPMRRAATRCGGGIIALSPWRLQPLDDDGAQAGLQAALDAPRVLFTSPMAVRAAAMLQPLRPADGQQWFAVGAGTAAALRRAGAGEVAAPRRMDSEGLLALPGLQRLDGLKIGLVTAPGGRGTLAPALQARGGEVRRADVYRRISLAPSAHALAALRGLSRPAAVAVSSGEGLRLVMDALPADLAARVRSLPVIGASDRLLELAYALGFAHGHRAADARPASLVEAAASILG
ncbi:uroporphyrinogen-III synthase [Lysobacter sp. F6437]|uniref:uroporphyrinogen-III synthase n=1 Tax=Lysobacter sp. F6437 TaxID=3459296 RepID=UPI00403D88E0